MRSRRRTLEASMAPPVTTQAEAGGGEGGGEPGAGPAGVRGGGEASAGEAHEEGADHLLPLQERAAGAPALHGDRAAPPPAPPAQRY